MVIIGRNYINKVGEVMDKVNSIMNDIGGRRPLAVFLNSNSHKENLIIDVKYGFNRLLTTPVMV